MILLVLFSLCRALVKISVYVHMYLKKIRIELLKFDVLDSYRKIQQDATVYQNLLFHTYMKLNVFRAVCLPKRVEFHISME
jgi:hypothetical protein